LLSDAISAVQDKLATQKEALKSSNYSQNKDLSEVITRSFAPQRKLSDLDRVTE